MLNTMTDFFYFWFETLWYVNFWRCFRSCVASVFLIWLFKVSSLNILSWLDSIHYISPDIRAEAIATLKWKILPCCTRFWTYFVAALKSRVKVLWISEKRNHQTQDALFYTKHTDKFTCSKQNLLIFDAARD